MIVRQLSVFLENKPGVLAEVCKTLNEKNVNIIGLSISDTVDYAVVRLVVDDPPTATHLLGERGALVVETEVFALKLTNKPGAMQGVAEKLAQAAVNIEYAYGSGYGQEGIIFLRVSDPERARAALGC
jgi:hypothetical protein